MGRACPSEVRPEWNSQPGQGTLPKPVSQEGVYHSSGPGAIVHSLFSMGILLFLLCYCVLGVESGADNVSPLNSLVTRT